MTVRRKPIDDAPLLQLTDATVKKNDVTVLDAINLTIRTGQHTAIIGPNGAGKTTLINLITHEDYAWVGEQATGAVKVLGSSMWDVSELRKQIGVISTDLHQRFVLGNNTGRIRARDAVVSGFFASHGFLINYAVTPDMVDKAAAALARVDAAHLADRFIDEMSPGEARRVVIARALVVEPRALVLDEPSAGLDIVARSRFLESVSRLAREGTTIVLISHHVEEIVPEIEQVVFLKGGRILDAGPKGDLLRPDRLSRLFGAPVTVEEVRGYYYARALDEGRAAS